MVDDKFFFDELFPACMISARTKKNLEKAFPYICFLTFSTKGLGSKRPILFSPQFQVVKGPIPFVYF